MSLQTISAEISSNLPTGLSPGSSASMDKCLRRLLPKWLKSDSIPSSSAISRMLSRADSLGSKDDLQRLLHQSFTVQASSASDGVLLISAEGRNRLYRSNSKNKADTFDASENGIDRLELEMARITSWEFNVMEVDRLSGQRPLSTILLNILEAEGLLDGWKVDRSAVEALVAALERLYRPENPYHNAAHAADVVQATWLFMRAASVQVPFTNLEKFSLLLAAAVHDLAHPGATNDFLNRSGDPLTEQYGAGGGVNERHHLGAFFSTCRQGGVCVLSSLLEADCEEVSEFIRSAVLSTDMGVHDDLMAQIAAAQAETPEIASWTTAPQRTLLLRLLLHVADLSNPCRPPPLGPMWGERICAEFLRQGDREVELGLRVSPFCDRCTVVVSTSQLRFVELFLEPLLLHMNWAVGKEMHETLRNGLALTGAHWKEHEVRAAAHCVHPHLAMLTHLTLPGPWDC